MLAHLKTVFGEAYGELHQLTPVEVNAVEVLSRAGSVDIEKQIKRLNSELNALERIKTLPELEKITTLAQSLKHSREPFFLFLANLSAMRNMVFKHIDESGVTALIERLKHVDQWIEMQELFRQQHNFKIDSLASGQQSAVNLNLTASLVLRHEFDKFEKEGLLSTSDIPLIPQSSIAKYKMARENVMLFLESESFEKIYSNYVSAELQRLHSDAAQHCFRQDLVYTTELLCSFSSSQYLLSRRLFENYNDEQFTVEEKLSVTTFKILVKFMYALGLPTTSALRIGYSAMGLWNFVESPHQFICFESTFNWEYVWLLQWIGLSIAEAEALSEEERDKLVARIPEQNAQLWVRRALEFMAGARRK